MMSLLYWHRDTTCPEAVPRDTLHQLRNHFRENTHSNIFLTGELLRLLNLFEAQG